LKGRIERCSQIQCLQCEAGCLGCIQYAGARPVPVGFVSRPDVPLSQVLSLIFSPPRPSVAFRSPAAAVFFFLRLLFIAANNVISDVFPQSNPFTILVQRRNPASKATPALSLLETRHKSIVLFFVCVLLREARASTPPRTPFAAVYPYPLS